MSLQTKTPRIERELSDLRDKNPGLFYVVMAANVFMEGRFGKSLTVTCIFRTPEENTALYTPNPEPTWRPHTVWEGVDLRTKDLTQLEKDSLTGFLTQFRVYRGKKVCFKIHTIAGNVEHAHVQMEKPTSQS